MLLTVDAGVCARAGELALPAVLVGSRAVAHPIAGVAELGAAGDPRLLRDLWLRALWRLLLVHAALDLSGVDQHVAQTARLHRAGCH